MSNPLEGFDNKEIELPETIYIHDVETRIFQSIVVQCLLKIEGISVVGGNLIDSLFGREPSARITGVSVDQDQKKNSINVKVEVNVAYGESLTQKAREIQMSISQELTRLTGLHVGIVHVIFKNLIVPSAQSESVDEVQKDETSSIEFS